jgi:hypothetical protein
MSQGDLGGYPASPLRNPGPLQDAQGVWAEINGCVPRGVALGNGRRTWTGGGAERVGRNMRFAATESFTMADPRGCSETLSAPIRLRGAQTRFARSRWSVSTAARKARRHD